MQCPKLMLHSVMADLSGCSIRMCCWCSFNLVPMEESVCPVQTLPHSQGILYMPGILNPQLSLTALTSQHRFHRRNCSSMECHLRHAENTIPPLCRVAITQQRPLFTIITQQLLVYSCLFSGCCLAPGVYVIIFCCLSNFGTFLHTYGLRKWRCLDRIYS